MLGTRLRNQHSVERITMPSWQRDQRLLAVPDGFDLLPVLPDHCAALVALPRRHRDPFDRMLIAQARAEHLALLTRDKAIIAYGAAGADVLTFDD